MSVMVSQYEDGPDLPTEEEYRQATGGFPNATPRPWTKNQYGQLVGSNGQRVHVYDLGVGMAMNSPDQEERDNAELFLTAVNARDALMESVTNLLSLVRAHSGPDDAIANAAIEQAEAALKLARDET